MSKDNKKSGKIIFLFWVCIATLPSLLYAQEVRSKSPEDIPSVKSLSGKVVDAANRPLEGASVSLRGLQEKTVTNKDGEFLFPAVMPDQQIEIYYIGYEPVIRTADLSVKMLIRLEEDKRISEEPVDVVRPVDLPREAVAKPLPQGGEKAFQNYLREQLIRPADAECKDRTGTVVVLFSTDEKGAPYNIRIKKGLCPACDHEAIRLINVGPRWTCAASQVEVSIPF